MSAQLKLSFSQSALIFPRKQEINFKPTSDGPKNNGDSKIYLSPLWSFSDSSVPIFLKQFYENHVQGEIEAHYPTILMPWKFPESKSIFLGWNIGKCFVLWWLDVLASSGNT